MKKKATFNPGLNYFRDFVYVCCKTNLIMMLLLVLNFIIIFVVASINFIVELIFCLWIY